MLATLRSALDSGDFEGWVIDNFNALSIAEIKRLLVVLAGYADGIITERGVSCDDVVYIADDILEAVRGA